MATRVFSDEELEGLRSFPAIGKAELVGYFTLTKGPGSSAGRGGQRWADTRLSRSSAHSRRARRVPVRSSRISRSLRPTLLWAPAARPAEPQYPVVIPPAHCDNIPVKEAPTAPTPIVLGIDDLRPLPRATRIARTSREGIQLLEEHRDSFIDELWLDHDLGGDDTIMPVVTLMEEAAFNGRPFRIGAVFVHSANPIGAETVVRSLTRWSYRVQRATA